MNELFKNGRNISIQVDNFLVGVEMNIRITGPI